MGIAIETLSLSACITLRNYTSDLGHMCTLGGLGAPLDLDCESESVFVIPISACMIQKIIMRSDIYFNTICFLRMVKKDYQ